MRRLKAWEKRRIFLLDNANCQYEGIASEFGLDEHELIAWLLKQGCFPK